MKIFKCIKIIGLIIWGANLLLGSTLIASAGEGDNLFGWAWNSEAGWISFNNCVYGGGCSGYSYGVNLNEGTYALSGYAWSSNVGWISFSASGTPGYSYPAGGNPQHGAQLDPVTRRFSGWAQILSLGSDGWVKLAKDSHDSGPDYYVELLPDGKLAGWAWNNMIGWISFNSADWSGNTVTYYVTGQAPFVPTAVTVSPDALFGCNTLNINWQSSLYAESYGVYRSGIASFTPTTSNLIGTTTNTNFINTDLALNTTYYYRIGASNFFGTVYTSTSTPGHTRAICGVQTISGEGDCLSGNPSIIELRWREPIIASGTTIVYYTVERCHVTETEDCLRVLDSPFTDVATSSDCYHVVPTSFDNPPVHGVSSTPHCVGNNCHCWETFIGEDVAKQYVYKITAIDNYSQPGDETNPTALIQIFPCSREKSWQWEEHNPATSSK